MSRNQRRKRLPQPPTDLPNRAQRRKQRHELLKAERAERRAFERRLAAEMAAEARQGGVSEAQGGKAGH